jgi:nitrite reductase/ring-hydroxylating ferredoxin subunit
MHVSDHRFAVVCPWHNFEFDLSTGCPPYAAGERCRPRVGRHDVVVEGDDVIVYG